MSIGSENEARQAIVDACLRMAASGLAPGRAGNVSVRWHRGGPRGSGMLVTPAAIPYDAMCADDIVWLALDAEPQGDVQPAGGAPLRPSSEWRLHRDAYLARGEVGAVVHTHSPAATALSCLPRIQVEGIPPFHYMIALLGGADIRCAPYRTFGTAELSQAALSALQGRRGCLLANHGAVALGDMLGAALELAAEVESLARMYAQALQLGEPALLSVEEIERVRERFAFYRGQAASSGQAALGGQANAIDY